MRLRTFLGLALVAGFGLATPGGSHWILPESEGTALAPAFAEWVEGAAAAVVELSSELDGESRSVLGTAIDGTGLVLSKSSDLGDGVQAYHLELGMIPARVLARDEDFDLVLIQLEDPLPSHVRFEDSGPWVPGRLLASVGTSAEALGVGVVGVAAREVSASTNGYLGVRAIDDTEGGALVEHVQEASGAQAAGLVIGDVIVSMNGEEVAGSAALIGRLRNLRVGESIRLGLRRSGGELIELEATLGERPGAFDPPRGFHAADAIPLSLRRRGFPSAVRHDASLAPHQVGGPVVDLEGRVVGLNIARADRPGCLMIPSAALDGIIEGLVAQASVGKESDGEQPEPTPVDEDGDGDENEGDR